MAEALGQPTFQTHPSLLKSVDQVWPGISRDEFAQRRRTFALKLLPDTAALIPAHCMRYSTRNILYMQEMLLHAAYIIVAI